MVHRQSSYLRLQATSCQSLSSRYSCKPKKKFTRPFRRVDECSWQKSRTRGVESPHARRKPTRLFIVGWIMRGPLYEEEAALDTPAGKRGRTDPRVRARGTNVTRDA